MVVKQGNSLPREVVKFPFLETGKAQVEMALANFI